MNVIELMLKENNFNIAWLAEVFEHILGNIKY